MNNSQIFQVHQSTEGVKSNDRNVVVCDVAAPANQPIKRLLCSKWDGFITYRYRRRLMREKRPDGISVSWLAGNWLRAQGERKKMKWNDLEETRANLLFAFNVKLTSTRHAQVPRKNHAPTGWFCSLKASWSHFMGRIYIYVRTNERATPHFWDLHVGCIS